MRDQIRKGLVGFLKRQGIPHTQAEGLARDPPPDLLDSDHPDLERYLELCCKIREADLGVDDETLDQSLQEEEAAISLHSSSNTHAAGHRSWGSPWVGPRVPHEGEVHGRKHGRAWSDQENVFAKNSLTDVEMAPSP